MIVIDASVGLEIVQGTPAGGAVARCVLREPRPYHVPHLFDLEIAHALRRLVAVGKVSAKGGGAAALEVLATLPLRRHAHTRHLERIWTLRDNLTAYDASYVALAEALGATLLTRDVRLAGAPGARAAVEVV